MGVNNKKILRFFPHHLFHLKLRGMLSNSFDNFSFLNGQQPSRDASTEDASGPSSPSSPMGGGLRFGCESEPGSPMGEESFCLRSDEAGIEEIAVDTEVHAPLQPVSLFHGAATPNLSSPFGTLSPVIEEVAKGTGVEEVTQTTQLLTTEHVESPPSDDVSAAPASSTPPVAASIAHDPPHNVGQPAALREGVANAPAVSESFVLPPNYRYAPDGAACVPNPAPSVGTAAPSGCSAHTAASLAPSAKRSSSHEEARATPAAPPTKPLQPTASLASVTPTAARPSSISPAPPLVPLKQQPRSAPLAQTIAKKQPAAGLPRLQPNTGLIRQGQGPSHVVGAAGGPHCVIPWRLLCLSPTRRAHHAQPSPQTGGLLSLIGGLSATPLKPSANLQSRQRITPAKRPAGLVRQSFRRPSPLPLPSPAHGHGDARPSHAFGS